MPPPAAAQRWQWFIQDYLQLPVTVAIRQAHDEHQLPAPDGRWYGSTRYHWEQNWRFWVVDQNDHQWIDVNAPPALYRSIVAFEVGQMLK
jgi:hypothetical protein